MMENTSLMENTSMMGSQQSSSAAKLCFNMRSALLWLEQSFALAHLNEAIHRASDQHRAVWRVARSFGMALCPKPAQQHTQ